MLPQQSRQNVKNKMSKKSLREITKYHKIRISYKIISGKGIQICSYY